MSLDADLVREALACPLTEREREVFTGWLARLSQDERRSLPARHLQWVHDVLKRHRRPAVTTTPAVLRDLPKRPPGKVVPHG